MRIAPALLVVPCLAAAALADDLKVPSDDYPTIQSAADAAQPGDRILVAKGTYYENVVMTQSNVTFLGKKAVWDGNIAGSEGNCLIAFGDGIVVQGFAFRNASNHVYVAGNGLQVRKCTFARGTAYGVRVNPGNGASVTSCTFTGGDTAVRIVGDGAVVGKCRIRGCDGNGILIAGGGALVERNAIANTDGDNPVNLAGNNAIAGNRMSYCTSGAIYADGDNVTVEGNRAEWLTDNGIQLYGDGFTVRGNQVLQLNNNSYAIDIRNRTVGVGGIVEGNLAADAAYSGFYLNVDASDIRGNTALRCGTGGEAGFQVIGSGNLLPGNRALECDGDGFVVNGDGNEFTACDASGGTDSGFVPSGVGNRFQGCTARGFGGQGFDNAGMGTDVDGCTFLGNRIDFTSRISDGATFGTVEGNTFSTGGVTTQTEVF